MTGTPETYPCCEHCLFMGTCYSAPHRKPCFRCDFAAGVSLFVLAKVYARDKPDTLNC